jgi:(p)ppGpp synthase/HD superfamily hydrolase
MDLENAILLASQAHWGQKDKAGNPYILHPLRVMFSLKDFSQEIQIVAVLHDTIEDTQVSPGLLRTRGFSDEVVDAVEAITHEENEPYSTYLRRVADNSIAKAVKIADIIDNMSDERLSVLDDATQDRLKKKYTFAMQFLTESEIWT